MSQLFKPERPRPAISIARRSKGLAVLCQFLGSRLDGEALAPYLAAFERPEQLVRMLAQTGDGRDARIWALGTIEQRFILVELQGSVSLFRFGDYGVEALPSPLRSRIIGYSNRCDNEILISAFAADLFDFVESTRVLICGLCHPETFPRPRFSLAIGDLLRAVRAEGVGWAVGIDMQLGIDVIGLVQEIENFKPDIIAISVTFGQQDLVEHLLGTLLGELSENCTVIVGGSLGALNRNQLLAQFPGLLIATGQGEGTIADVVRYQRGEIAKSDIVSIAYVDQTGAIKMTPLSTPRTSEDMIPELDLLRPILEHEGVLQLESSRGCSYSCSFCPREHKGVWSGDAASSLDSVMPDIRRIFDNFPNVDDRVFLVDEEFVGYGVGNRSEDRVVAVANKLADYGFVFETSARADQIYRPAKDDAWQIERIELWRSLISIGLNRCLFGIESGVDTILTRFNKKVGSKQNAIAIRIASLIGLPPRYTYITFDPLMSIDELSMSAIFLGRDDLLLSVQDSLSAEEILHIARNDEQAALYASGRPFSEEVTYQLVSMECLEGAPYTTMVKAAGLLGEFESSMGRYQADYADTKIGMMSDLSQRWIDRNFAIEYHLKSLQKLTDKRTVAKIGELRKMFRSSAYDLLRDFVSAYRQEGRLEDHRQELVLLDEKAARLTQEVKIALFARDGLAFEPFGKGLVEQFKLWASVNSWEKIN